MQRNKNNEDLAKIDKNIDVDVDLLEKANEELSKAKDKLKIQILTERFFWFFGVIILVDCHVFATYETWGAPIAILVLELCFLFVIAASLEIESFLDLIRNIMNSASGIFNHKSNNKD